MISRVLALNELVKLFLTTSKHNIDLLISWNLCLLLCYQFIFILFIIINDSDKFFKLLLSVHVTCVVVEHSCLNDLVVKAFLVSRFVKDTFFDVSGCDQTENFNLMHLSNTMCSIFCLLVHLWVPIRIEDDNCVRNLKVKAMTTSFS